MPSSVTSSSSSLSLHDALPILLVHHVVVLEQVLADREVLRLHLLLRPLDRLRDHAVLDRHALLHAQLQHQAADAVGAEDAHEVVRSEEHTSELQSPYDLVCRLLSPLLPRLFPYTTLFRSCLFITSSYSSRCLRIAKFCASTCFCARSIDFVTMPCSIGTPSSMPSFSIRPLMRSEPKMRMRSSDRKSTRLNSSHRTISYAVFCHLFFLVSFPTRRSSDLACSSRRRTRAGACGSRSSAPPPASAPARSTS